jgi:hypothetical protein
MSLTDTPIFFSSAVGDLAHGLDVHGGQRVVALADLGAEEEVAPHLHQRHHGEVLVDGGDAVVEGLARGAEGDRVAVDLEGALGVRVQPGDDFDQGGLAGAVVAQHAGHLAGVDGQVDAGQGDDGAEGLADVLHLDQRFTGVQGGVGVLASVSVMVISPIMVSVTPGQRRVEA